MVRTYCMRKHSVPSSGRKERTLPALWWISIISQHFHYYLLSQSLHSNPNRRGANAATYKLFNATQVSKGMMPYQQFPPQFGWSQRRTPPMLRFWWCWKKLRGLARVVVARVRRRVSILNVDSDVS